VLVASGTKAVLHNKKTDLHFKAQENYVDEKCVSTLLSAGRSQSQYFKIHHVHWQVPYCAVFVQLGKTFLHSFVMPWPAEGL